MALFAAGRYAKVLALLVGIALVGTLLWWSGWLPSRRTYGTIYVDSPEVYTRERLVNDRFLQHAWLMALLDKPEEAKGGRRYLKEGRSITASADVSAAATPPAATGTEPPKQEPEGEAGAAPRIEQASRDRLHAQLAYRDEIRGLLIENQLDDRHDLNGNALYHFKFDVTVVPGWNTQALARVTVRVLGPAAPRREPSETALEAPEVEKWHEVYLDWIESLEARLNRTHESLKRTYHGNAFLHNDYARLIAFLKSNLKSPAQIGRCPSGILQQLATARALVPLSAGDHDLRKACIQELVRRRAAEKLQAASKSEPLKPSDAAPNYISTERVEPVDPRSEAIDEVGERAERVLEYWLNVFFASKTVQLVLGVSVPESTFIKYDYFDVKALQPLMKLSFFNPSLGSEDGSLEGSESHLIFKVSPRDCLIMAIDAALSGQKFDEVKRLPGGPNLREFSDFRDDGGRWKAKDKPLKVSAADLELLEGDLSSLGLARFEPVDDVAGVYVATARDGLWHFIQRAQAHSRAFTYAVSPKESADSTVLDQTSSLAASGSGRKGEGAIAARLADALALRAENRNAVVVGFGNAASKRDEAEFGWIIGPRESRLEANRTVSFHGPAQHSLSALVSVPSWWSEVNLRVSTDWIDSDGEPGTEPSKPVEDTVDLPIDFEPLERALLEVQQAGPELFDLGLDPVRLVACTNGAIVIPGERLWRSTVVTLGTQRADEISVLPDMKGILARFLPVENQATPEEMQGSPRSIERTVRVWTSEGSATLSAPATIAIPDACGGAVPASQPGPAR
jgi:hypothetical protein